MSYSLISLGNLAKFINGDRGKNYPSKDSFIDAGFPFINAGCLSDQWILDPSKFNYISEEAYTRLSSGKIQHNDILFCLRGSVGKFAVIRDKNKGAIASSLIILRVNEKIDVEYLKHYLASSLCKKELDNYQNGAAQPNLSANDFKKFLIPLPSLEQQRRIASILDKADELRQKRQQAIEKLNQLLQATFIDMFGDPVSNPKGWNISPLKNNITHVNNGLSRRRKESENIGDIVLRLQDVHYDGIRFKKELNRIKLDESEKKRFKVEIGDILFIRVNGNPDYVGRSAVFSGFQESVYHNDHLIRIKLSENYNPYFLSYCLNSDKGKNIISKQVKTSAGQHTVSQSGIECMNFYVPPKNLQEKWCNFFINIEEQKQKLYKQLDMQVNLFKSLQNKAFSGTL